MARRGSARKLGTGKVKIASLARSVRLAPRAAARGKQRDRGRAVQRALAN